MTSAELRLWLSFPAQGYCCPIKQTFPSTARILYTIFFLPLDVCSHYIPVSRQIYSSMFFRTLCVCAVHWALKRYSVRLYSCQLYGRPHGYSRGPAIQLSIKCWPKNFNAIRYQFIRRWLSFCSLSLNIGNPLLMILFWALIWYSLIFYYILMKREICFQKISEWLLISIVYEIRVLSLFLNMKIQFFLCYAILLLCCSVMLSNKTNYYWIFNIYFSQHFYWM